MPFVRIDLIRGKPVHYRKAVGDIIHRAMIDLINAPENDKFQVSPNMRCRRHSCPVESAAG